MEGTITGPEGEERRVAERRSQSRSETGERRSGWPPPQAEAPPAAPEIIVETGPDDLSLSSFFSPRLWVASLVPLLFVGITSYLTSIRITDSYNPFAIGQVFEDVFFTAPDIGIIGRHLLPFGIPTVTGLGYGYVYTSYLQTSSIVGLIAMFIGMLLVVAATRRSNDAVYLCGPYFVYSGICIAIMFGQAKHYQGLGDIFPALLASLLIPMLTAMGVKVFAVWMRNLGLLEADLGRSTEIFEHIEISPGHLVSLGADGAGQETIQPLAGQHVARAVACPFCGNPKVNHEHPGTCSRCHMNISLHLELPESPHCPTCDGILVRDAAFCHHCGVWLKGAQADAELGLERDDSVLAEAS